MKTNCPFTLTEYRSLIRLARSRFQIVDYHDYSRHDSFIIWRHDVEYSLAEMSILAAIDAEEGMQATFFLQLHSETYNFWSREVVDQVMEWLRAGHRLGLHFDANYYGIKDSQDLEDLIQKEQRILEEIYETRITAFAYHSPTPAILGCQDNYAGLVNTYNTDFFGGKIIYVSDSNGRWRDRTQPHRDQPTGPRAARYLAAQAERTVGAGALARSGRSSARDRALGAPG